MFVAIEPISSNRIIFIKKTKIEKNELNNVCGEKECQKKSVHYSRYSLVDACASPLSSHLVQLLLVCFLICFTRTRLNFITNPG